MDYVEYVCEAIDTMREVVDWHYVYGIIDTLQFANRLSFDDVQILRSEADKKLGEITAKKAEVDEWIKDTIWSK